MQKKQYSEPTLTVHGTVEELTLATGVGRDLDRAFPANTPAGQLTFS